MVGVGGVGGRGSPAGQGEGMKRSEVWHGSKGAQYVGWCVVGGVVVHPSVLLWRQRRQWKNAQRKKKYGAWRARALLPRARKSAKWEEMGRKMKLKIMDTR